MIRLNSLGAYVANLVGPWRKLTRAEWTGNRWKIAGRILAVLGIALLAIAIQNWVFPRHTTEIQVTQSQGSDAQTEASRKLTIPDVVGLDERTARTVLRDAGLDGQAVEIVPQPAAGAAGFVISQQPDSGTAVKEGETPPGIRLALSTQATMPDVVGLPRDQAAEAVEKLHGAVQISMVASADREAGAVLSTEPAAGQPMPVGVTLTVADGGTSLALASLDGLEPARCREISGAVLNGVKQGVSLGCTPAFSSGKSAPASIEYAIARAAKYFTFTAGIEDTAKPTIAEVEVLGDGKPLSKEVVSYGSARTVRMDVTGVLRLRIVATTSSSDAVQLVLGDAKLVGNPNAMAVLQP